MYPPTTTLPVYSVLTAVAIVLTVVRFWTRISYTKTNVGADDWFIFTGVVICCGCTAIQFYNALEGTGGQAVTNKDDAAQIVASKKADFVMVLIEKPAFGCIKLSLLFFYKRIFDTWNSFRKANTILIGVVIAWTIAFIVGDLAICGTKLHYVYLLDQSLARDHCGDKGFLLLMFAITSVLTDMLVLGLPFFYIRRLQMPPQKKLATCLVFFLGFISTAAGMMRTIFLGISYPMGRMAWGYVSPPDQPTPLVLQVFNPTFWVMVEMFLGTWAANLPPLGPLLGAMGFREWVSSAYRKVSAISTSWSGTRTKTTEKSYATRAGDERNLTHQTSDSSLEAQDRLSVDSWSWRDRR
ncbi:uncharacterized protein J7T54_001266 [Emericellopsis cladophorae]|uniref:Rhodopsin domain-containing protein n=1 Tax=Emericellopsis cladophorae TaxID=2686198 RepID=A0A9P9Y2N7_9HYPO|nr:uncharacterized protein J7T54_001266 [Emericellopsis cladophorae]KAI6782409.1 hypothetical protein J7T54_001266 [Emericellopsis cladophorae]